MDGNNQQKAPQDFSVILRSGLFSNLLPGERQIVTGLAAALTLRKGGLLFSPGVSADRFYFLKEGLIRICKAGGDGEIARFTPGDTIGDVDFARGAVYDARAEALEDSSLVMFPGPGLTMDALALEAPHVVSKILLNSVAMITGRIKSGRKLVMERISWVQELQRMAHEDPGTGLWKQTFLTSEINRLLEAPMALIMLKPDRFKVLVDTLGHEAGDEAMVLIAAVLKNTVRRLGRGWALRFRSNETGILVNKCGAETAESLARSLSSGIAGLPAVPMGKAGEFPFSCSTAWGVWPGGNKSWDSFFEGTYGLLMDTWKAGGDTIARYQAGSA